MLVFDEQASLPAKNQSILFFICSVMALVQSTQNKLSIHNFMAHQACRAKFSNGKTKDGLHPNLCNMYTKTI